MAIGDPAFQLDGRPLIDSDHLSYEGIRQSGIVGGALAAIAPDFTRAALGVSGMNYSTLLTRSSDFDTFAQVMYPAYPNELERPLIFSLVQMLWARAEANGYAQHITRDPYPDTPQHAVLLQEAFGDHQVANVATEVEARTIGARLRRPAHPRRVVVLTDKAAPPDSWTRTCLGGAMDASIDTMLGRGLTWLVACAAMLAFGVASAAAAEYDTLPIEAKAADGIALRGHAFLPKGTARPLATVLSYSPYFYGAGAEGKGTDQVADDPEVAFLLDAGFAYAAVNLRGTGHSEGCMGFGDRTDQADAGTVVQTIAAQPWSNGSVGMYGHSFPAWSQMMAMAAGPPALKAIVPTSGAFDPWTLLMRRGAPINAEGSATFGPIFTAATGHPPPYTVNQACPKFLDLYQAFAENSNSGDRTAFYRERDLRDRVVGSPVAMLGSLGIMSGINDGHTLQFEGMWDRLRHDRTHFVLGQWGHDVPTSHKPDWHAQVIGWFDHYLRGAPDRVGPGVEFQDDDDRWHVADRWPPRGSSSAVALSGGAIVGEGEQAGPVDATFASADNDPGLRTDQPDEKTRLYNSTCGPTQALFTSRTLAKDVLLAGNVDVDLDLTSTQPGGNLSVFFWRTTADGSCPDQTASWWGRALMDLRHWATPGQARDFPVGTPTRVRLRSHPLAAVVHKGERIVIAIGGGSSELEPDPRHPSITVTRGAFTLPVVAGGRLQFAPAARR